MTEPALYPLRFDPTYEYRPWGGRRLADLLGTPLPAGGSVGEAWVLSDREAYPSRVSEGPLGGRSLREILLTDPEQMMGVLAQRFSRFPLLLKFLDVRTALSVQVHPAPRQASALSAGETGKTEAWVVLEAGPSARIYAGLEAGATVASLRHAIAVGKLPDLLASFVPEPGDTVLIPAGTVHALRDVVVFEVQQNSDVTFRLYDWDNVDARTGRPRALQIEQALACINVRQDPIHPIEPDIGSGRSPAREHLLASRYFSLWRIRADSAFTVGATGRLRVLVCTKGEGHLDHHGTSYPVRAGQVWVLPAQVGTATFRPAADATLLEVAIPEGE